MQKLYYCDIAKCPNLGNPSEYTNLIIDHRHEYSIFYLSPKLLFISTDIHLTYC